MLHTNLSINENHHLAFAGVDTVEMAKKHGTPLYLMDEARIREKCRLYLDALAKFMPEGSGALFASKACSFREIYRIVESEGMRIDVVSSGEIYTAKTAGFPMERAYFHGSNKTEADLDFALDSGVGTFIVDNTAELDAISRKAQQRGIRQKVLLRLTPGIDPHTLEAISTGKVDSKFGTAIETGQALLLVRHALSLGGIELCGFHCHIGSQVFDTSSFRDGAKIMLGFMKEVQEKLGFTATVLNLGGGFGVRYVEEDPELDIVENIRILSEEIKSICTSLSFPLPAVLLEPGRSIVADAGLTLYTVGNIKTIPGYKNYVSIDGGMTDNPRYALYGSKYTVAIANRMTEEKNFRATVAGRCCESGDLIQENVLLPTPEIGDVLAVFVTGAYNYSMASNYNRVPRPPIVMLKDGKDRVVVKRESLSDLCLLDL